MNTPLRKNLYKWNLWMMSVHVDLCVNESGPMYILKVSFYRLHV
jgi:hypothetical protein